MRQRGSRRPPWRSPSTPMTSPRAIPRRQSRCRSPSRRRRFRRPRRVLQSTGPSDCRRHRHRHVRRRPRPGRAPSGCHAELDRHAVRHSDRARQLCLHGRVRRQRPARAPDRQALTIQVNPASPVSFDALWNGLDSNWYNPANWSPRGVPAETLRVYFSAATSVVPRLTADVTVRDLFLEPGARSTRTASR